MWYNMYVRKREENTQMTYHYTVEHLIEYLKTLPKDTELKIERISGNLTDGFDLEYEDGNLVLCNAY